MPTTDNDDVIRILIDLVRDQGRVLAAIAEGTAVGADRQARTADVTERMVDVLGRLDAHIVREEAANAHARAASEDGRQKESAALTRLYDTVRRGLQSSTGQRVIQTLVLALGGWLTYHGYIGAP